MSFSTVRTEVKRLLESVSGIGRVHDYRRHTRFWDDFYKRHVKQENEMRLNDWEITRISFEQIVEAAQGSGDSEGIYRDIHQVLIIGHMAVRDKDESEKDFQDLIDEIVDKFQADNLLDGVVLLPRFIQAPIIDHKMFGSVLVHYTEMTLEAIKRVSG